MEPENKVGRDLCLGDACTVYLMKIKLSLSVRALFSLFGWFGASANSSQQSQITQGK